MASVKTVKIEGQGGPAAHVYRAIDCGCAKPAVLGTQGDKAPPAGTSSPMNVAKK